MLGEPPRRDGSELRALAARVDALEIRADRVGDLDPAWLRQHFSGALIYTLRSVEEGGEFRGDAGERAARLRAAAATYDQVDLEWARDLTPDLLDAVPAARRRVSRHEPRPLARAALTAIGDRMRDTPAALYMLSIAVESAEDAAPIVALCAAMPGARFTAFATGAAGLWTRLLAPHLGAPVVFGQLETGDQDAVPTLTQLHSDYGFPDLVPVRFLYGIVGSNPGRSRSPQLHNRAYRIIGLPALYLPFFTRDLERFWQILIPALEKMNLPLRGVTVVTPFKERVLALVDHVGAVAATCGAANVAWRDGATWRADTTDSAILELLAARGIAPHGQRVAVVGCGAAGRAIAAALAMAGAEVVLVNRGWDRGRLAEHLLALPFVPLESFSPVGFTLIIHATPVTDRLPFPLAGLARHATVLELVYADKVTPVIDAARAHDLTTVDGLRVLGAEVAMQFELMTGRAMPTRSTAPHATEEATA
ncbi:MAG TPA: type I 3-dehydroquinate dehydratase [Kofleriaceae bacterium]|nr:type I 3-dehydroquinate dehydratase [Kofleriaceae bacterium]